MSGEASDYSRGGFVGFVGVQPYLKFRVMDNVLLLPILSL